MSCHLCDSVYHFTHNCDKYESDESRQEALVAKNWCPKCYTRVSEKHAKTWTGCRSKSKKNCYLCFSRDHHTIFCPDRYTVPNMIVPNIDTDLHERFFKLFKGLFVEEFFMALISQKMFDKMNAYPHGQRCQLQLGTRVLYSYIQLFESIKNSADARKIEQLQRCVLLVTDEVSLDQVDAKSYIYKHILHPFLNFPIYFIPKKVILNSCHITDKAFMKLLSTYTRILECHALELTPAVKFVDVLRRVQNIQELILDDTNILTDNFWADNLLRYKNSNNFLKLETEIYSYKFNIECLAAFVKTKCVEITEINIYIINEDKEDRGHEKELSDKLSNFFVFAKAIHGKKKFPIVSFYTINTDDDNDEHPQPFASFTGLKNE